MVAYIWQTPAHTYYSGYTMAQLKPLVAMILDCCQDGEKHHRAIFKKYSSPKFKKASTFVEGEINAGFELNLPATLAPASPGLLSDIEYQEDDSYTTDPKDVTSLGYTTMYSAN